MTQRDAAARVGRIASPVREPLTREVVQAEARPARVDECDTIEKCYSTGSSTSLFGSPLAGG